MSVIPEQNDVLKSVGSFIGEQAINATAIASAIIVLRSGIRDPKIIAGAFALYGSVKQSGSIMGGLAGEKFDLYLKNTFGIDVDKFINENIKQINEVVDTYFNSETTVLETIIIEDNIETTKQNIEVFKGGYGDVKLYKGNDGSYTYSIPSDDEGNIKVIVIDKNGNVLKNDFDINETTILDPVIVTTNQEYSDAKTMADLLKDPNNLAKLEDGTLLVDSGEIKSDGFVDYKDSEEEIRDKRKQEEEEYRKTHSQEESDIYWGGVINTAVGQIGSLVIANNQNFSNIEKLAVNTSFSTLGDFAVFKYGGSENGFNTADTALDNLKGAVVSFALASFFAKNDNIADILGMDGTFIGGLADFTVSYTLGYYGSQAVSELFASLISINNIDYKNNKIFKNVA